VAQAPDPFRTRAVDQVQVTLTGLIAKASRLSVPELVSAAQADLRERWQRGERVLVETYLDQLPMLRASGDGLLDLVHAELLARADRGEHPDLTEYLRRFPGHEAALEDHFNLRGAIAAHLRRVQDDKETTPPAGHTAEPVLAGPGQAADELHGAFGRYRIERLLGRGGMGSVYLAHDTQLDRRVALKVLRFRADDSPQARDRFFREARAAATLEHPNICPVFDVGTSDGIPYLTMAYIEGMPLTEFTRDGQRLPPKQVAILVGKLALALAEAHQRGIIHRDIKPSNVMLNRRQEPILMDFGLARMATADDERLTRDGQALGTPAYMPPEQVNGQVEAMGPGCDIYSLGALLYEMLTGRTPFRGTVAEIMAAVLREEPRRPSTLRPGLDPRLDAICSKALAKKIADRYASMTELSAALEDYVQAGAAPPDGLQSTTIFPADKPSKRSSARSWVLAAAVLVAAGAGVAIWTAKRHDETATPTPPTALAGTPQVVAADDKAALAHKARAILETNCYRCHGKDDAAEGGFRDVLDVGRMVAHKKLVPGNSAASKIYRRITAGEMPPDTEKQRPSAADSAVIGQWLDAGAPAFADEAVVQQRPFRSTKDVLSAILAHQNGLPAQDRPRQRYFTLTSMHNNKAVKDAELRLARAALAKTLNSLSWAKAIVVPTAIDPDQIILAVDVAKLDWDRSDLWHEILKEYPYGLKHDRDLDEAVQALAREVYEKTGTDLPYVRADWFVATASRPPLYHTLLGLPQKARVLEGTLQVDSRANFLKNQLARAGFASSGISRQNRLVERSDAAYGAYWRSYDFKSSADLGNLFRYPLGPEFPANPFERQAFQHDGGEILFNLPNGLQAYMLVDGKDERIDEAPIEVVSDALKTSGTVQIINGLSCLACHGQGVRSDFKDTVRTGTALQGEPLAKVRALYPSEADMKKLLDADSARFLKALERATGPFLKVGADQAKDIKDFPEPVGAVARQYLSRELTLVDAALELGLDDPSVLYGALRGNDHLRRLGLAPLTKKETIKRQAWESLGNFISPYQEVASALQLGTPKRVK
jgi:predicted Ser/Thr protein kinase/mono/diheme cytochrome c family protein